MSKIKSILAFAAVLLCGGAWASTVAYWNGDLANNSTKGKFSLSYNTNKDNVKFVDGRCVVVQRTGTAAADAHGLIVSWPDPTTDTESFTSKEMTVAVKYSNFNYAAANYALVGALWGQTTTEVLAKANNSNAFGSSIATSSSHTAIGNVTRAMPTAGILVVTFSSSTFTMAVYELGANGSYTAQTPTYSTTDSRVVRDGYFYGLKISGSISSYNHYYRPGMTIEGVAIFDSASETIDVNKLFPSTDASSTTLLSGYVTTAEQKVLANGTMADIEGARLMAQMNGSSVDRKNQWIYAPVVKDATVDTYSGKEYQFQSVDGNGTQWDKAVSAYIYPKSDGLYMKSKNVAHVTTDKHTTDINGNNGWNTSHTLATTDGSLDYGIKNITAYYPYLQSTVLKNATWSDLTWSGKKTTAPTADDDVQVLVANNPTLTFDGSETFKTVKVSSIGTSDVTITGSNITQAFIDKFDFTGVTGKVIFKELSAIPSNAPGEGVYYVFDGLSQVRIPFDNASFAGTVETVNCTFSNLTLTGHDVSNGPQNLVYGEGTTATTERLVLGNQSSWQRNRSTKLNFTQEGNSSIVVTSTATSQTSAATLFAHYQSQVVYDMISGKLTAANDGQIEKIQVGWDGSVTWNIGCGSSESDNALVIAKLVSGGDRSNSASVHIGPYGTLKLGSGGLNFSNTANKKLYMDGGKIVSLDNMTITTHASAPIEFKTGTSSTFEVPSGKVMSISSGLKGSGTIVKTGAGKLLLSGALTEFTGTITIEGGSVAFSNTDEKTIANTISGAGAVIKEGTGTITFTGANTYTGGLTVSAGTVKFAQDISEGGTFAKPTITANDGSVQIQVTMSREAVLASTSVAIADLAESIATTENFSAIVINADTGNSVECELSITDHVLYVTPQGAKQSLTYTPTESGDFDWTTGATIGDKHYRDYDDIDFATTEFTTAVTVPSKIAATALNVGGIYNFSGKPIVASTLGTLEGADATFENDVVADTITVNKGTVKGESFVASNVSVEGATFGAKVVGPSMRYVRLKVTATQGGGSNVPAVGEFRLYRGSAATGYTTVDWPMGTKVTESTGLVAVKDTEDYPGEVGAGLGSNGGNECQPGCLIDGFYGNKGSPATYGGGSYKTPAYNKWWPTSQASGPWTVTFEFPYPVAMFSGCNFCLADHGPRNPTAWTIEVSNDGTNWTEVNNTTGATWSSQYAWYGGNENVPGFLNSETTPTTVSVGNGATILADGNWTAALNVSGNVTLKGVAEKHLTLDAASTSTFAEGAALTFDLSDYSVTKAGKQYVVAGPLTAWPAVEDITITPAGRFTLGKDANGYYVEVMSGSYWLGGEGGVGNWNLATDAMWAEDAESTTGLIWLNGAEAKFTRSATVTVASGVEASGVTLSEGVQVTMSGTLPTIGASGTTIGQNAKLTIGGTTAWSGTVTNNGVIRYSDLSGSVASATYLATPGKVELGSVTVTGGSATSTLNVPTGDEITLSISNNSIPVNVCGGEVTFNNGVSRVWNDAAFTMTAGHATVATTTTGQTGNGNGFLLGVYDGLTMNISGGIFEIPNSSINFWGGSTASGINLSGTGVFKAKGGFNGNSTGNVTIADTACLEVGSLGWTATAANVTLNGGTLKGYEDNASIASPIAVAQASKISAASGTTLTVTGTITGSAALTIGDATDNGTVNLSGATMTEYTGSLSFSGSSVVLPSDFGGTVNGAEAKIVGDSSVTYYTSLSSALSAAPQGQTVTLIGNVTLDAAVTVPAGVTLDIGSHTINGGQVNIAGALAGNGTIQYLAMASGATLVMPEEGRITVSVIGMFGTKLVIKNAATKPLTYLEAASLYIDNDNYIRMPYAIVFVDGDNETIGLVGATRTETGSVLLQAGVAVAGIEIAPGIVLGFANVAEALEAAPTYEMTYSDIVVFDPNATVALPYAVSNGGLVMAVAKIGEKGYATLAAALSAAEEGETVTLISSVSENVTIPENVTVVTTSAAQLTGTVKGSGVIVFDGIAPSTAVSGKGFTDAANWRGTVWFKNYGGYYQQPATGTFFNFEINNYGNANSRVKTTNIKGYFNGGTITPVLEVEDEDGHNGFEITAGGNNLTTALKLAGTGTLKNIYVNNHLFKLTDVSDFTGSLDVTGKKFEIGSRADCGTQGKLVIDAGMTATLAATSTYTAPNGILVNGGVKGNGNLAANVTFANNAIIDLANGALTVTSGHTATFSGGITIKGAQDGDVVLKVGTAPAALPSVTLLNADGSASDKTGYTYYEDGAVKVHVGDYVAELNGTYYDDVATAISAAVSGNTVNVLKNVTGGLVIPDGVTVNLGSRTVSGAITTKSGDTGTGIVIFNGNLPVTANALNNAAWKGTVWIKNVTTTSGDTNLGTFGHSGSTIELTGANFFSIPQAGNFDTTIKLTDEGQTKAWTVGNGYSRDTTGCVIRKLTGSGSFVDTNSGVTQQYTIKDATEFTGSFTVKGKRVIIGETAESVNGTISIQSGFAAKVALGAVWTADGGVKVSGSISGAGTIASRLRMTDGVIDGTAGALTLNGGIVIDGIAKVRVAAVPTEETSVKLANITGDRVFDNPVEVYVGEATTASEGNFELAVVNGELVVRTSSVIHFPTFDIPEGGRTFAATTVSVKTRLSGSGGVNYNSLTLGAEGELVYDPIKTPIRVTGGAPSFAEGAKIGLDEKYAAYTKGKFMLMTWEGADIATLPAFDTTTAPNAPHPAITVETYSTTKESNRGDHTYHVLMLNLDTTYEMPKLKIMPLGDSITEGSGGSDGNVISGNCANYRMELMKKMMANGYDVSSTGFRRVKNVDASGTWMPMEWSWHNGISGERVTTAPGRAGFIDSIDALIAASEVPDVITFKIGTNDGNDSDAIYAAWVNVMWRIIKARPTTKIVCGSIMPQNNAPAWINNWNNRLKNAITNNTPGFPANQVYFADLWTNCPRTNADGSSNFFDGLHPNWRGHEKNAETFATKVLEALAAPAVKSLEDPTKDAELVMNAKEGAYNNVDRSYTDGMIRLRMINAKASSVVSNNEVVYDDKASVADDAALTKVGYYVELKHKLNGHVRWVWVDMDATGKTVADVDIPVGVVRQEIVTKLHIDTNDFGIEKVAANVDTVSGWVQFGGSIENTNTIKSMSNPPAGAPATYFDGYDWNDNVVATGNGLMQVYRLAPSTPKTIAATTLFAYSRYGGDGAQEIGIGDCAMHGTPLTANNRAETIAYYDTYQYERLNSTAYDVARVEIWGAVEGYKYVTPDAPAVEVVADTAEEATSGYTIATDAAADAVFTDGTTQAQYLTLQATRVGESNNWKVQAVVDNAKLPENKKIDDTAVAFANAGGLVKLAGATEKQTISIPKDKATAGLYYSVSFGTSPDNHTQESDRVLATSGEGTVDIPVPALGNEKVYYIKVKASATK